MTISQQLNSVRDSIKSCAASKQRLPRDIILLAVSKRHPSEAIRLAYAHKQYNFGENYLNEALSKQSDLTDLDITWHYIGIIQSNKTRKIAENFAWVHTVDNLKVAQRLAAQRPNNLPPLNICLQINIDEETSKSGLSPDIDKITNLVKEIISLSHIQLRGLMCIPSPKTNKDLERQTFKSMQSLLQQLNERLNLDLDTLSMGMSNDLDSAIECGATMVRVGTAIFGKRPEN